jgi:hypothetical protein
MAAKPAGFYSITFTADDGDHTAITSYAGGWNDERAEFWARKTFGDAFKSIRRSDPEGHEALVEANLKQYASRTPLDEKTGGQMNRIISQPELAKAD